MTNEEDFELTLFDRIETIKTYINTIGEDKFYISFSGGKDSTILSHLIDLALPNNKIPRVYINTGIEFLDMVKYVRSLSKTDSRIKIITPGINIKSILNEKGYPFKSKEHSMYVYRYNLHPITPPSILKDT